MSARVPRARLWAFAAGDFAFNLYWQSVMLFLLFYYTEALGLPMQTAAFIYMTASVWDGIANFWAGLVADRRRAAGRHRTVLMLGAVPLGAAFMLAYLPPPLPGMWGLAAVLGGHMIFRTAYAFVNVPYLALSARVSAAAEDRALVAGLRMLFGSAAAAAVALGTVPLGAWIAGPGAVAYLASAALFGVAGAALLLAVGASVRETAPPPLPPAPVLASLRSLAANRAFVTLNLAMTAMIVAVTVLNKSVLYYFKYRIGDEAAGQLALASMAAVSALAVPLWVALARPVGARGVWFLCAAGGMAALAAFGFGDPRGAAAVQVFLIAMQVAVVGLHFAFWALLPNTIEYGERATGLRVEGTVFGLAALIQRIAIGVATAILGLGFGSAGFTAGTTQSATTLDGMRWTIAGVPMLFLALSAACMATNPLRRGTHERVVAELAAKGD